MPFNSRAPYPFVTDLFNRRSPEGLSANQVDDPKTYSSIRGLLISKKEKDVNNAISFQFNPNEIRIRKGNIWETRRYTGRSEAEELWVSGDRKTISFTLQFNTTNTQRYFNPVEYVNREKSVDPDTDRGTLAYIEPLESFQYPEMDKRPTFVRGNVSLSKQFFPPPVVVFVYGQFYFECKVLDMDIRHLAWNEKLIPVHSEVDITLTILEGMTVNVDTRIDDVANGSPDYPSGTFSPSSSSATLNTSPQTI